MTTASEKKSEKAPESSPEVNDYSDMASVITAAASDDKLTIGDVLMLASDLKAVADLQPPERTEGQSVEDYRDQVRRHQKFTYAAGRNLDLVRRVQKAAERQIAPGPKFREYGGKLQELGRDHCAMKDGRPVTLPNNTYAIDPDMQDIYDKKRDELKEEYKAAIADREVQVEVYNGSLHEPIDIKLHMIERDNLPDTLTPLMVAVCSPFIVD